MSDSNHQTNGSGIASELGRLGENLGKLLKSVWGAEERHYVENEFRSGMEQFAKGINNAADSIKNDEMLRKAREAAKDAWQTARGPQIVNEVQIGITEVLKRMNDELAKKAERKDAHEASAPADEPAAAPPPPASADDPNVVDAVSVKPVDAS